MDKRQLVAAAARRTALTQNQIGEALDALMETLTEALTNGETVVLRDFGRFETQEYPARRLRRFDGPGHHTVEGRRIPAFRSSPALRRRLREGR
jgi:DNA-binding protein HU-beta